MASSRIEFLENGQRRKKGFFCVQPADPGSIRAWDLAQRDQPLCACLVFREAHCHRAWHHYQGSQKPWRDTAREARGRWPDLHSAFPPGPRVQLHVGNTEEGCARLTQGMPEVRGHVGAGEADSASRAGKEQDVAVAKPAPRLLCVAWVLIFNTVPGYRKSEMVKTSGNFIVAYKALRRQALEGFCSLTVDNSRTFP